MENYRSRNHCLLLYPEDLSHVQALEKIKKNYNYAYIKHDKDLDENGELKKEHFHVIIQFKYAKWRKSLANELGITENYIEKCNNFDNALEYLIHDNDTSKHQYELEEVQGPLKKKLERLLFNENKDENEKAYELIDYISNYVGFIDLADFSKYCCVIGMWDVFRRSQWLFLRLIDNHNSEINNFR